jgi:hypothetical protein
MLTTLTEVENTELLREWDLNAGAAEESIRSAMASLPRSLPGDYLDFIRTYDGGEGFVGDNYLVLWRVEDLATFNREYEVDQYAPGLLMFGSDGGGEGYAFDTRAAAMPIVRVPFIGMDLRYARPVANTFTDLLAQLRG